MASRILAFFLVLLAAKAPAGDLVLTAQCWGQASVGGSCPSTEFEGGTDLYSTGHAFVAVDFAGSLTCWGNSNYGGSCTDVSIRDPAATSVVGNWHAVIALDRPLGTASCWGLDGRGGECNGVNFNSQAEIYSTWFAFMAFNRDSGTAYCWGDSTQGGECDGIDFQGVTHVHSNAYAFVAWNSNTGVVHCWGKATYGGSCDSSFNFATVAAVHSTLYAFAAVDGYGRVVRCWGSRFYGGDCSTLDFPDPMDLHSSGHSFLAINRQTGVAQCWGSVGFGGDCNGMVFPSAGTRVYSTWYAFMVLDTQTGTATCWGNQGNGGNCDNKDFTGTTAVYSTGYAFAAINANAGTALCWGGSTQGGDCTNIDFRGVQQVQANGEAFVALMDRSLTPAPAPTLPSRTPTTAPTLVPTSSPTNAVPTFTPTGAPTAVPTAAPTAPTPAPTPLPPGLTFAPTAAPTALPTFTPTGAPTADPTAAPTAPTLAPTPLPPGQTLTPTAPPTLTPTAATCHRALTGTNVPFPPCVEGLAGLRAGQICTPRCLVGFQPVPAAAMTCPLGGGPLAAWDCLPVPTSGGSIVEVRRDQMETVEVSISITIQNVNYDQLASDVVLFTIFQVAVTDLIVAAFDSPVVTPENVRLQIRAGSVIVDATIVTTDVAAASAAGSGVWAQTLASEIGNGIRSISGIDAVSTSNIEVDKVSVQISSTKCPAQVQAPPSAAPATYAPTKAMTYAPTVAATAEKLIRVSTCDCQSGSDQPSTQYIAECEGEIPLFLGLALVAAVLMFLALLTFHRGRLHEVKRMADIMRDELSGKNNEIEQIRAASRHVLTEADKLKLDAQRYAKEAETARQMVEHWKKAAEASQKKFGVNETPFTRQTTPPSAKSAGESARRSRGANDRNSPPGDSARQSNRGEDSNTPPPPKTTPPNTFGRQTTPPSAKEDAGDKELLNMQKEIDEAVKKLRTSGTADERGKELRTLKRSYHPDAQKLKTPVMQKLFTSLSQHVNGYCEAHLRRDCVACQKGRSVVAEPSPSRRSEGQI